MWSQATGIHSIKPSLKIDAPTPAQPPPRLRDSPTPAPSAGSTQLQSSGRQGCQIARSLAALGARELLSSPGVVTRNKRRQLAAFRADRAIKAKLQDRGSARRRREGEREIERRREGQRERGKQISNIFLVTAAFLRRVSLSNYNWLFGCIFTCEVIFSAHTDTPSL